MKMKSTLLAAMAISVVSSQAVVLIGTSPITLDFNNLNTDFGGAYNATGGSTTFPASSTTGTAPIAIYSGPSGDQFTVSTNDFNPGGVYSNTDSYSISNSVRALQNGSSSDYAIGVKDSTDRQFILGVRNNTGSTVSSWNVAYDIEQYSTGASASVFSFSYSLNGSTFITTNLTGATDYVATTSTGSDGNLATILSAGKTGVVTETIAAGSDIFFRWTYDHKSGTSTHLGIDNITVTAIPEPSTALLGAIGALALLRRRR